MRRDRAIKRAPPKEGWRKALADEEDALISRHSAAEHLRRRHQSRLGRDREARALASHRARRPAAFRPRRSHPRRQQPDRPGVLPTASRPTATRRRSGSTPSTGGRRSRRSSRDGGFDAVVGNPPYVKLQNFRKVHADMAAFLARSPARAVVTPAPRPATSTSTSPSSRRASPSSTRMGGSATSPRASGPPTTMVAACAGSIGQGRNLYGWIDFGVAGLRGGDDLHRPSILLAPPERRRSRHEGPRGCHPEGAGERELLPPALRPDRLRGPLAAGDRPRARPDRPADGDLPAAR